MEELGREYVMEILQVGDFWTIIWRFLSPGKIVSKWISFPLPG
jgi:putative effector of murein hydrolase LrgA (UPF0299 family)